MSLLIFGSSKAPWRRPWRWIASRSHQLNWTQLNEHLWTEVLKHLSVSMHSTCSTISKPNRLTVASPSMEIWPFECPDTSKFWQVWTLVIASIKEPESRARGDTVIPASMHGYPSYQKFKSPVTLTMTVTLDRVKVTWTCTLYVRLPAYPSIWL